MMDSNGISGQQAMNITSSRQYPETYHHAEDTFGREKIDLGDGNIRIGRAEGALNLISNESSDDVSDDYE